MSWYIVSKFCVLYKIPCVYICLTRILYHNFRLLSSHSSIFFYRRSSWQGKINSLKALDACYSAVKDSHISRLTDLPALEELNLDSCPIGDWTISHLESVIPNLVSLDLADTDLSDLGMVHLAKFKKLKRLSLFYCNLTNSSLQHLSSLSNLEVLNLDSREIDDNGLWHLQSLQLKSLDIFSGRVTDQGCSHIAKIKSLENLECW